MILDFLFLSLTLLIIANLVEKASISADLFTPLKKCASSIISASSDHRRMQRSSLEPPRRAASNGGIFILLRPLDAEIFNETLNGAVTKMLNTELLTFY